VHRAAAEVAAVRVAVVVRAAGDAVVRAARVVGAAVRVAALVAAAPVVDVAARAAALVAAVLVAVAVVRAAVRDAAVAAMRAAATRKAAICSRT